MKIKIITSFIIPAINMWPLPSDEGDLNIQKYIIINCKLNESISKKLLYSVSSSVIDKKYKKIIGPKPKNLYLISL